jgi:hypothetical protein
MECNKLTEHPIIYMYLVQATDKEKTEHSVTSTRGHATYTVEGRSISTPSCKILVGFNTYNRYYQREGSNYHQNGRKQLSQETSTYEPYTHKFTPLNRAS